MSNNNPHRRTLSLKFPKAQRPALARGQSSPKQSLGRRRTIEVETTHETNHEDIDMTFLQFCPTCDKQIIVPNSLILYCSESCRRKDGTYRDPAMALESSALPEDTDDESPVAPRTIVQPRSPSTLATFHSKPPMLHAFRPDLDPTEWKPDSAFSIASSTAQTGPEGNPEAEPAETRPHHYRAYSAAFTYLSQFHGSATSFLGKGRRPKLISRASTPAVPLARTAPSTITLPAMSAGNSTSSDGSGFLRTPENGICGRATLHPSGRPSTCAGLKGVDLVKPTFSATVAVKEGELVYGKKLVAPPATGPSEDMVLVGSLSRFLGGGDADAATVQSG